MSDKKYGNAKFNQDQLSSFSDNEKSQLSREIFKEKNELEMINKEIEIFY